MYVTVITCYKCMCIIHVYGSLYVFYALHTILYKDTDIFIPMFIRTCHWHTRSTRQ